MKVKGILSTIVGGLVAIGVIKGLIQYQHDGGGVGQLATNIVNGVADWTVRLMPTISDLFNNLFNG